MSAFALVFLKVFHLGFRVQLHPLNTYTQKMLPTLDPTFRRPTFSVKKEAIGVALWKIISHSIVVNGTEKYVRIDACDM